jgi:hypothetical protein
MYPMTTMPDDVTTIQEAEDALSQMLLILNLVSCFCHADMEEDGDINKLWHKCSSAFVELYGARRIVENIIAGVAISEEA